MPSAVGKEKHGAKRKFAPSTSENSRMKRAKSESSDDGDSGADMLEQIAKLEEQILESKKNYNNIVPLIKIIQDPDTQQPQVTYNSSVALTRVFIALMAQGSLSREPGQSEKDLVVIEWLRQRFSEFRRALVLLLRRDDDFSEPAFTLLLKLLKSEGLRLHSREEYSFPQSSLHDIMEALLESESSKLQQTFVKNFANSYADIRFYTMKSIKDLLEQSTEGDSDSTLVQNAYSMLASLELIGEDGGNLGEFYAKAPKKKSHPVRSIHQQRRQASEAWLALMRLSRTKEQRKRILDVVSSVIAPWFAKPELLSDFLTDSYNTQGSMSLLALSGVFYLIQERNLDYPSFYPKLYSLLDADVLHSKHRSRFFRLLDTFLASTHLPAVLVASFIKRLARLLLNAPPSAIVLVVPFVYNLLKRHPLCTFMIHREVRKEESRAEMESGGLDDPFLPDETDPMLTRAIDSSLWEIVQLQSHYHPNVASIAKIISQQFTKQSYNIEDFLDHSYASLLDAELSKDVKKTPVVEYQIPKRILLPQDAGSDVSDSMLVKLWDFSK